MNLQKIKFHSITIKDFKIVDLPTQKAGTGNGVTFSIVKHDDDWYLQTIEIDCAYSKYDKFATIVVENSFLIKMADDTLVPRTDTDISFYADMTQMAISQTRALFNFKCAGTSFENDYMPTVLRNEIISNITNGTYSWLN